LIDSELKDKLEAFGAVLIVGPKWCGKTTTASQISKSILRMQDPDTLERNMALARLKPSELLIGDNPRLIDEWQTAPQLWDSIRLSVDLRDRSGLYILTGSTSVDKERISHSGTGRIDKLKMSTMSLFESGDSIGSVSLTDLFNGNQDSSGISSKGLEELAGLIVRGGWPQSIGKNEKIGQNLIKGYCENIIDTEEFDAIAYNMINMIEIKHPELPKSVIDMYCKKISTEDMEEESRVFAIHTVYSQMNADEVHLRARPLI